VLSARSKTKKENSMDTNGTLTRIQSLLPVIRARRQEIEQARRLPRDLVEELRKTGMFSLGVPRAIGGEEARPVDLMQVIETVATADGSTGWCAMIATGNNVVAGYMSELGAKEVFADPTAPSAGIAAITIA
jgi:alkylation response protein AidB-like acyl-CoA dehydrogenase